MWDKREKNMYFRDHSNFFYSNGSELPSRENARVMLSNDGPEREFIDEASRKRKAVDSDFVSNSGYLLPKESSLHHNVLGVNPQQITAMTFSDHYSHPAKPATELSHCGDHQCYSINNSLMSFKRTNGNFSEVVVDGLHHKLESYYNQSSNCVEKVHAAHGSNDGMNLGGNNNLPKIQHPPQVLSSRDLTFLGPSQSKMVNENYNQDAGLCSQSLSKSGLIEMKKSGQNTVLKEDNDLSGQTSVHERKATYGLYPYSDTEMRLPNYRCNDSLGSRLNVSDKDMLPLPAFPETSGREEALLENGLSKDTTFVSTDLGTKPVERDEGSEYQCHSFGEASPKIVNLFAIRPVGLGDDLPSLALDKQSKSAAADISPVTIEKLWDGSLQLNTSTTVSAVAFFKSGEKAEGINWPEHLEIKGKVRLQAFEKFIQELPRSRNRALMVISLCWKVGSSKAGLSSIKAVARGYRENERVGFAEICPSFDLYLCPCNGTIITILAKHGFLKGIAEVEEDQDSFIGCIIWRRRNPPPSNQVPKKSDRKEVTLQKQLVNSLEPSILESNSPIPKVLEVDTKQAISDFEDSRNDASDKPANSAPETDPTYSPIHLYTPQQPGSTSLEETMEHGAESIGADLGSEPTESVLPGPETQQLSSDHPGPAPELNPLISFNSQEESTKPDASFDITRHVFPVSPQLLPEILQRIIDSSRNVHQVTAKDITEASKTPISLKPTGQILPRSPEPLPPAQQKPAGADVDDDLPEFDFSAACGVQKAPLSQFSWPGPDQLNKQNPNEVAKTESMQRPQAPSFPEKSFKGVNLLTEMESLTQPSTMKAKKGRASPTQKNRWDDDDDMPEWCPPDLEHREHPQPNPSHSGPSQVLPGPQTQLLGLNEFSQSEMMCDDMPEWCPPDLEYREHPQPNLPHSRPSPVLPRPQMTLRMPREFAQSDMRRRQNQSPGPPIGKFQIKLPGDVNWRWPRA